MIDFQSFVEQHREIFEEIARDPSLSPEEKSELEKAGVLNGEGAQQC